jgi:hypothetical protein
MALPTKKVATAKKLARPPIQSPNPGPDPLGLFPALSEQLKQAYDAQVRAFLRKVDLVKFAPAVRQRIRAAETASGGPATFLVALTVHPGDASGFPRLVGRLPTPLEAPSPAEPPEVPEDGQYIRGLFGDKIPLSRLKPAQRRKGRRR